MSGRIQAATAAAALLAACAGGQKVPDAPPPEISSQELDLQQDLTTFDLRLAGKVKSARPARIDRAKWEMVVDGNVIKSGEQQLGIDVPADAPADFEVKGASKYVSSPDELKAMSERGGSLLAALRGTLYVSRDGQTWPLEFARSREVRTPRLPVIKLHEIDGARYSDREVNVHIWVGVVNPNPFPLSVGGLTYASTIAGKEISKGMLTRGDTINPAATGVFEISYNVNEESHGKEVVALIKSLTLPWTVSGELKGELFQIPYALDGTLRLNVSR